MNLADYEQELVDQIYELLIEKETTKYINLYGDVGCGKSTVALAIANQLQEDWSVFYIKGIDPNLSPYLTWHIGTKLYSKTKLNLGSELSFGVSFQPFPISLEFGGSFQKEKCHYILTPCEEALISNIKKQAAANKNLLFIVDNYELWDIPSKQFIQKIMLMETNLLSDYRLVFLFVTLKKVPIEKNIPWTYIKVPDLSDADIFFVIRQCGYAGVINMADIRACARNDLSLALMAANYYDTNNSQALDFNTIMDKRYNALNPEERKACKVLEPLSIIDSYFTKDETAYFIDQSSQDKYENEYLAEEYLSLAEDQLFIIGNESFHFTNEKIKSYFRKQLAKSERLYHRKFAYYLQNRHPEDYFNRGKHLMLSIQLADYKIILQAWQLLLLSYIRRSTEIGTIKDVYNIIPEIQTLLNRLPGNLAITQRQVLYNLLTGYREFVKYNYRDSLRYFQSITPSQLSFVCLAECQRLILLCYIQLAENRSMIFQTSEDLYNTIEHEEFLEDEQYCRAALVLLDVYLDRSNNYQRMNHLKNNLIRIIQNHLGCPTFEEFEACYNRKASLYYAAIVAHQQTAQSVQFYRNKYSRNNLYMALCNHSGNAIVCGKYDEAESALKECNELLENGGGWYYPSQYKVENNMILLTYLIEEKDAKKSAKKIFNSAHKAIAQFAELIDRQEDEVSYITLFNYLGLSILCNSDNWQSHLKKMNDQLTELDEYYQYFLHDLNFAVSVLQGDIVNARNELTILMQLEVPLLRYYKPIFLKRRQVQEELIKDYINLNGDAMEYHKRISDACIHIQDPSCYFYGRGFLLSDLQFLSL